MAKRVDISEQASGSGDRVSSGVPPGADSPVSGAGLFCDEAEAAGILGITDGGLGNMRREGRCPALYVKFGSSVRWSRPAVHLAAIGLGSPEALGRFVAAAGIKDLDSLLRWLDGGTEDVGGDGP